jgi:uncharacterized protein
MPATDLVGLKQVQALSLEDCWVRAGFVRNAVWNHLHGRPVELSLYSDVDVVYWDTHDINPERDVAVEKRLFLENADIPWSAQSSTHART